MNISLVNTVNELSSTLIQKRVPHNVNENHVEFNLNGKKILVVCTLTRNAYELSINGKFINDFQLNDLITELKIDGSLSFM